MEKHDTACSESFRDHSGGLGTSQPPSQEREWGYSSSHIPGLMEGTLIPPVAPSTGGACLAASPHPHNCSG